MKPTNAASVYALDALAQRSVGGGDRVEKAELVEALQAICRVPSERTLLLNAEARAMYEIAKRALEAVRDAP